MRRLLIATATASLLLAGAAHASALLRLNGIGPLKLGMQRTAAVATGWIARRHNGCELGGKPFPIDYGLSGTYAPAGLVGDAEFSGTTGKLTSVTVTKGARTAVGVVVRRTTVAGMLSLYRKAGFSASSRFDSTFGGTFVLVRRHRGGALVLEGFAPKHRVQALGVPFVPVCD